MLGTVTSKRISGNFIFYGGGILIGFMVGAAFLLLTVYIRAVIINYSSKSIEN